MNGITKLVGPGPGPTLAIFAGVHGDELAGIYALDELLPKLQISRGTLFLVLANMPAINDGVRMLGKNLNRCFLPGNSGSTPEDIRARELMKLLDQCDALLDLHMFHDDKGEPFVICETSSLELAKRFNVNIVSTNWTNVEPGATDGYMHLNGKVGICMECGPKAYPMLYIDFAKTTILQFLKYYRMVESDIKFSSEPKRHVVALKTIYKKTPEFALERGLANFQKLKNNQIIATDKKRKYKAGKNECIIFPHYNARVGEEAYILGVELL